MGIYDEKVLAMEEYCLKDEKEFLQCLTDGDLREKIKKRIGHLNARLFSINENKKCQQSSGDESKDPCEECDGCVMDEVPTTQEDCTKAEIKKEIDKDYVKQQNNEIGSKDGI